MKCQTIVTPIYSHQMPATVAKPWWADKLWSCDTIGCHEYFSSLVRYLNCTKAVIHNYTPSNTICWHFFQNWNIFIQSNEPYVAIWRHRSGSTLAQAMVCCLTVPSHYLNQLLLLIGDKGLRAISQEVPQPSTTKTSFKRMRLNPAPLLPTLCCFSISSLWISSRDLAFFCSCWCAAEGGSRSHTLPGWLQLCWVGAAAAALVAVAEPQMELDSSIAGLDMVRWKPCAVLSPGCERERWKAGGRLLGGGSSGLKYNIHTVNCLQNTHNRLYSSPWGQARRWLLWVQIMIYVQPHWNAVSNILWNSDSTKGQGILCKPRSSISVCQTQNVITVHNMRMTMNEQS